MSEAHGVGAIEGNMTAFYGNPPYSFQVMSEANGTLESNKTAL